MPTAPAHPCNHVGCGALTHERFCPAHKKELKHHAAHRGNTTQRGYGNDWQKVRSLHIKTHPLCADPYHVHGRMPVIGKHVDHIVSIEDAPERRLDPTNLQTLCENCHNSLKQKDERSQAPTSKSFVINGVGGLK